MLLSAVQTTCVHFLYFFGAKCFLTIRVKPEFRFEMASPTMQSNGGWKAGGSDFLEHSLITLLLPKKHLLGYVILPCRKDCSECLTSGLTGDLGESEKNGIVSNAGAVVMCFKRSWTGHKPDFRYVHSSQTVFTNVNDTRHVNADY